MASATLASSQQFGQIHGHDGRTGRSHVVVVAQGHQAATWRGCGRASRSDRWPSASVGDESASTGRGQTTTRIRTNATRPCTACGRHGPWVSDSRASSSWSPVRAASPPPALAGSPPRARASGSSREIPPRPRPWPTSIAADGGRVEWVAADLRDEAATVAAFGTLRTAFGRFDGLFAVAGGSGRRFGDGPIHEIPLEGWQETLDLNGTPAFMAAREVVRVMLDTPAARRGRAWIDRAGQQRAGQPPVTPPVRDPCLCGGQGRGGRAGPDDGRVLRAARDPRQRPRARPGRDADVRSRRRPIR